MNFVDASSSRPGSREITLHVIGRLDLAVGLGVGDAAEGSGLQHPYVLDLEAATVLDSGLAWILMFKRRIEKMGGSLMLSGLSPELQHRCKSLGITVDPPIGTRADSGSYACH